MYEAFQIAFLCLLFLLTGIQGQAKDSMLTHSTHGPYLFKKAFVLLSFLSLTMEATTPSILSKFRLILKVNYWIGLFHCKIKDGFVLQPTAIWLSVGKWVTYLFLLQFGLIAALWNLSRPDYTPGFLQCVQILGSMMFGPETKSGLSSVSFIATPILTFLSGLLLACSAPFVAQELVHLEKHLQDFMPSKISFGFCDLFQSLICSML